MNDDESDLWEQGFCKSCGGMNENCLGIYGGPTADRMMSCWFPVDTIKVWGEEEE
jgi:hypothetical protein